MRLRRDARSPNAPAGDEILAPTPGPWGRRHGGEGDGDRGVELRRLGVGETARVNIRAVRLAHWRSRSFLIRPQPVSRARGALSIPGDVAAVDRSAHRSHATGPGTHRLRRRRTLDRARRCGSPRSQLPMTRGACAQGSRVPTAPSEGHMRARPRRDSEPLWGAKPRLRGWWPRRRCGRGGAPWRASVSIR
jgi:hypothetical protein